MFCFSTTGLFIDGALTDTVNWPYPRMDNSSKFGGHQYTVGELSADEGALQMSWSVASAYLVSTALGTSSPSLTFPSPCLFFSSSHPSLNFVL